jgi:adenylate cyclase
MSWQHLTFGPFVLDTRTGTLLRQGKPIAVSYRAIRLLTALLKRPGEVLSKSDLIEAAWQGTAVEEGNLAVQIASLRKLLALQPDGSEWIATIPRVGYRFAGLIERQASGTAEHADTSQAESRPSIAVLPFLNLSDDATQDYFADGIVADIITGLSRIRWLLVIARNSSFVYKGRAVDVRQIGRELGVRYILEGGVRKVRSRLRINAQLLDAASGAHLWADRFDGAVKDVFDLQDDITEKVVAVVEPNLRKSEIERSRRKHPANLDAYDLYLHALPHTASQMPADARVAMPYLERALCIDPDYAAAHALLAWCHEWCFARDGFAEADKLAAIQHARAALVSSTDDATALAIAGFVVTMLSKDHGAGLTATERALQLNPSCATAMYLGAIANAFAGRSATAVTLADRALRLSPFDPLAYQAHFARGAAAMQAERYDEAAVHFQSALEATSRLSSLYFFGAAALAMAGQPSDAQPLARVGLDMEPTFRHRMFAELMVPQLANKLAEGCRRLGLPQ